MRKSLNRYIKSLYCTQKTYNTFERWVSYWHQIQLVANLAPKKILEVGFGNGLVASVLRYQGLEVVTSDYDYGLLPDVCCDVQALSFKNKTFDVVLCSQVLEHIKFCQFESALGELARLAGVTILSLPHSGMTFSLSFKIPHFAKKSIFIKSPFPKTSPRGNKHQWEIGWQKTGLRIVNQKIENFFKIERTFIDPESPWHRFFILKSKKV